MKKFFETYKLACSEEHIRVYRGYNLPEELKPLFKDNDSVSLKEAKEFLLNNDIELSIEYTEPRVTLHRALNK